jgi:hypothetical protein
MKRDVKMTTVNVGSNYAGKVAGDIIGKTFKEADTLRLGLVTVIENINYKLNLRKISYTDGRTAYTCGFTPAGAITLSEKVLEPTKFKNDFQVCKEDFRATWSEDLQGSSAQNPQLASDIESAILGEVLGQTAEKTDNDIWVGTTASTASDFIGFIPQFLADSTVIDVIGATAGVSESNVETQLKLALNAVPVAIRRTSLNVLVSPDVFQAYWFYLVSKGIANGFGGEEKQAKFGKYTLTEVNGLPDNTIVIADPKNLVFGTGLLADHNEISAVDEDAIGLLTGQVRGKLVYNMGVSYYNGAEIVYYRKG